MRVLLALLFACCLGPALAGPEREITACEICGGDVYQTPKTYKSNRTKYVYLYDPPHKPYCTRCQRDVNNGEIDPDNPPALAPRDGEDQESFDNPYSRHADRLAKEAGETKRHQDPEAEGGFGAIWYVAGILAAVVFALRFFLKG